ALVAHGRVGRHVRDGEVHRGAHGVRVVPIVGRGIGGHHAVGTVDVGVTVVVEVAEDGAPPPPTVRGPRLPGHVTEAPVAEVFPQHVALDQVARFGDVGDVDAQPARVLEVPEGD